MTFSNIERVNAEDYDPARLLFDDLIQGDEMTDELVVAHASDVEPSARHRATPLRFTANKAVVGAITSGAAAGLTAFTAAFADGAVEGGEWFAIVLAILAGAGVTGGTVYGTTNHIK